ncbi:MAG TPA: membrane protein insertase YidC [Candidatus Omnitrophota bacterium]|nr:membrane protein insertase YidC [Candidatus Omnitrophota bacterium]
MEKRLLLSVFLSLLVLYIWAGMTQPKRTPSEELKLSQHIYNKEVIEETTPSPLPAKEAQQILNQEEGVDFQEDLIVLENDKLSVTFTNKGGTIKSVYVKDYKVSLPISNLGAINGYEHVKFDLQTNANKTIAYSYLKDNVEILNTYELSKDEYLIKQESKINNVLEMSKQDGLKINGLSIDMTRLDKNDDTERDKSLNEYVINSYSGIQRKGNAFKFSQKEKEAREGHVVWLGFRDRYYCAIFKPEFKSKGYQIDPVGEQALNISIIPQESEQAEGGGAIFSSTIFVGPEEYDILKGYDLGLENIKKFYRFGLFDIIAMLIYKFMHLIYRVIPNWGMCIIIISAVLYFSMYPLTLRGMSSMKKMQSLQPEIERLKQKHSNNPQKMNQEIMALYKEYKINPLGGCLPFLLQMPVFIGLYQVLWRSVVFKGAKFLWINDLSEPDRLFILPFKAPFMGDEVNILPILMMIIMFFQQRITSKNMVVTDPIQQQQQKMMGIFMPILLGVIFYKFASGLTLYFTMFYIFSTFTQYHMYHQKRQSK